MSGLLKALHKAVRASTPRTLTGRTNLLAEVISYGEKTIKVKALNSPIAGQEIEIIPGKDPVSKFSKPSKAQTSSYTEPGGILRFDGVMPEQNGTFKAAWVNAFIKKPNESNVLLLDQVASYRDTTKLSASGKPLMVLSSLDAAAEKTVTSFDDLNTSLVEALKKGRGAMLIDTSAGAFEAQTVFLPGKKTPEGYVFDEPEAFAATLVAQMREIVGGDNAINLTVVPVKSTYLGSTTSEEIKKKLDAAEESGKPARIMSVNPLAYQMPGIGDRIAAAFMRTGTAEISAEHQERLQAAFLAQANETAKAAFHSGGWRAVSNTDLTEFFAAHGVALKDHPTVGWNKAAVHLQKYEGGNDFFVAKTYETSRYGSPYPALECCKGLRDAYNAEMTDAIRAVVVPALDKTADKAAAAAATADAPEVAPEIPASADAAGIAEAEVDIDNLLDSIADDELELG